jgi:hypothetical protein
MGFTVAGTVPDSHRIPFYTLAESQNITIRLQRYELFYIFATNIEINAGFSHCGHQLGMREDNHHHRTA